MPESIFSHISKGAALPNAAIFASDKKLRLGFEVYCLSHFDSTEPARFLTLCTALEVLAPSTDVPQNLKELDRWIATTQKLARDMPDRSQDCQQLESRLAWLKRQSHTGRIRDHVRGMLANAGDPEANDLAREAAKLYGLRGRLTHEGQMNLGNGVDRLYEIICRVLRATLK